MTKKITIFFVSTFFLLLAGCGGYDAIDSTEKSIFLSRNGVFSGKVLSASMSDDLIGQFPIVEIQDDQGAVDQQQSDSGSTFVFQDDNGNVGYMNQFDDGAGQGGNDQDQGQQDYQDDDSGSPMPTQFTDDGMGGSPLLTVDLAPARQCLMTNGKKGVQYLTDNGKSYSDCSPCAIFDPKISQCVKINAYANKKRKKKKSWLKVGALLIGALAIGTIMGAMRGPASTPPDISIPGGRTPSYPGAGTPGGGASPIVPLGEDLDPSTPYDPNDPNCPLIIDVSGSKDFKMSNLELSAPDKGIQFPIRGQKNNYKKIPISWTNNPRYMFLVKPNEYGHIVSINELFGNHTLGPDKQFAENGFAALAKYDGLDFRGQISGPREGLITERDPIYKKLRLWSDKNFDGIAQPTELKTLKEMGVVTIDLNYDSHFYERDQYGNEAIFKSVVKFDNGNLGMMFDLWFK